ncbi:MAG: hypothetical protein ABI552_10610 [Casimicrobiaceae bacterium]
MDALARLPNAQKREDCGGNRTPDRALQQRIVERVSFQHLRASDERACHDECNAELPHPHD